MAKIIDDETMENVCILAKLSLSDEAKEKAKEERKTAEPVVNEEVEEPLKDFGHVFDPLPEVFEQLQAEEFKLCYQYTIKATKRELETIDTFLDSIGVDWSK